MAKNAQTLTEITKKWTDKTIPYPKPDPYGLQGQCVQFIRYCLAEHYCLPQWPSIVGAADFWSMYERSPLMKSSWIKIPNTPSFIPEEGDICIWNKNMGSGYGHIGIVYGNEQSVKLFTCVESNWKPLKVSVVTHNYVNVLGFFRVKEEQHRKEAA